MDQGDSKHWRVQTLGSNRTHVSSSPKPFEDWNWQIPSALCHRCHVGGGRQRRIRNRTQFNKGVLGTPVLSSPTDKRIPTRNSFGTFGDCSMANWRWWWNPGSASFKAATPNWHGPRPTQTPQTVSQAGIFTVPRDYPYLIERLSRSFSSSVAARELAHTPIYYVWAFAIFADCQMDRGVGHTKEQSQEPRTGLLVWAHREKWDPVSDKTREFSTTCQLWNTFWGKTSEKQCCDGKH